MHLLGAPARPRVHSQPLAPETTFGHYSANKADPQGAGMEQSKPVGVLCLVVAVLLAACASTTPTGQWTPQDIDALAREYAASAIENWGLAKGSPREAKLRGLAVRLLSSESVQAAARNKPAAESWADWGNRIESEGLTHLSDDALRRFFGAQARLYNDATDTECTAYARGTCQ
jgi:hypothetical protein